MQTGEALFYLGRAKKAFPESPMPGIPDTNQGIIDALEGRSPEYPKWEISSKISIVKNNVASDFFVFQGIESGKFNLYTAQLQLDRKNINPSIITVNTLISLCESVEEGEELIAKYNMQGEVDIITVSTLISLCESVEEGEELIAKYNMQGEVNIITVSTLISLCESVEEGEELIASYKKLGLIHNGELIKLGQYLCISLMGKAVVVPGNILSQYNISFVSEIYNKEFSFNTIESILNGNTPIKIKILFLISGFINFKDSWEKSQIVKNTISLLTKKQLNFFQKQIHTFFYNPEKIYDVILHLFSQSVEKSLTGRRSVQMFELGGVPVSNSTRRSLGLGTEFYQI